METCFTAAELYKEYGSLAVIQNWNLQIERGERVAILGPSGSGKTTFLRMIAGLEKPDSGYILNNSIKIGFVFQEPRLIPWRTVKENLLFVNENGDYCTILEKLNLQGFSDYYPSQLSGGMKQRVNLARALIINPDLLILDEAFSSLDLSVKASIIADINRLWSEFEFTIISVTHDLKEAIFLADRIIILSGRPSQIIKDFPVDLGPKRDISSTEFLKLEGQLLNTICFKKVDA